MISRVRNLGLSLAIAAGVGAAAEPVRISAPESLHPPTPSILAVVHAAARREGWPAQVPRLRTAANHAYEQGRWHAAEAWHHVLRWAEVFGQPETGFVQGWIKAVEAAGVAHPNMPASYTPAAQPLGAHLSPALQAWLLGNAAFAQEFFLLLDPVDYLPAVFTVLDELYRIDPARLQTHASLALALALVYDVPPPPIWPHGQVTSEALPRRLATPAAAFEWWKRQERLGRTYHRLSRLGAAELKFVVDAVAPFTELEWAQEAVRHPLGSLEQAYAMIPYRAERVTENIGVWPGRTYRLAEILASGGICSDQAYFATQVGKARGVPTLLIYGAGNDGRHAWFGFLDGNRQWQLDAGRYAEQRFVTGYARDPQTWREFSDHELRFLSERFHEKPSYRQSRVHALFAADYLEAGLVPAAAAAARKAVSFERRNQAGWEILIATAQEEGRDAKAVEALLREAALAFQRYPDLEAHYIIRVSESLRARGETSAADAEARRIALKHQSGRIDLSVRQARERLLRAIAEQPLPEQIRTFNFVVDTTGRGGGIGFFDEVVNPFVEHLLQRRQLTDATRALERARRVMQVESNSQLDAEFSRLAAKLTAGGG